MHEIRKEGNLNMKIIKVTLYKFSNGVQCNVKTAEAGRLACKDEALCEKLQNLEGADVDLVVENGLIVGINETAAAAPEAPAEDPLLPDEDVPFADENPVVEEAKPAEPAKKTPAKKAAAPKAAKAEPAAPAAETETTEGIEGVEQTTTGLTDADKLEVQAPFPLMRADEIEVRVAQVFDWGATLLLYKNARCDQERLDAKYGPLGWQKKYEFKDGKLFCTVSVKDPSTGEWVAKEDVGTESNTEAEKGQASDAFKRACVCWGSGRELYSAPVITIKAADTKIEKGNNGKLKCNDKFVVKNIGYDDKRQISSLEIYGQNKRDIVFRFRAK